jgi:ribosomal protein S19
MPRAKWKGPNINWDIVDAVNAIKSSGQPQKASIRVQARAASILPDFIGYRCHIRMCTVSHRPSLSFRFAVHNGRKFEEIEVKEPMVGLKFGDFALTRARPHPVGSFLVCFPLCCLAVC